MVRVRGLTGWFLGTGCETKNGRARLFVSRSKVAVFRRIFTRLRAGNISITIRSIKSHRVISPSVRYVSRAADEFYFSSIRGEVIREIFVTLRFTGGFNDY